MSAAVDEDEAFPTLTDSQLIRLRALAEPVAVAVGDILYAAGAVGEGSSAVRSVHQATGT